MKSKESWIIINPKSGGGNANSQKQLILEKAVEMGWQGKYLVTSESKNGKYWVKEAIRLGIRQIIIGGGDGTIRDILKPVVEGKLTLGIIPLGTGNVLAKNLEIPLDIEQAIKVALHGEVKVIDMGEANGNYFGVVSGMGVDVDMMGETSQASKSRLGIFGYIRPGLQALTKIGKKYRVLIDNKESYVFRAKSIMVANMARTVAGIEIAKGAGPQSGDLKVVVIMSRGFTSAFNLLFNVLKGKLKESPYYKIFKAQKVEITPLGKPRNYECDGDEFPPIDKLQIIFHPKALRIRLPSLIMGTQMVGEKRKILIFDFDGTIADSLQTMITVFNNLAGSYNFNKLNNKQVKKLRGQSAKEVIEGLGIDKLKLPGMLAKGKKEFQRLHKEIKIIPGMKSALLKLKGKYGLGIVTSNEVENVNKFLKSNDLQIFDFIYSDHSIFGKGKVLRQLIKKYDFGSNQLIYIGDEVRDIDAARANNMKIASVGWGFNTKDVLLENKPDWWVNKPSDLTELKF
jgi:phosphoglycolate phosphatase